MHVRAQIREYVRAQIATIPEISQYVTIDSEEIPEDLVLPWVHVSVGDEDVTTTNLGGALGRKQSRGLQLAADIYCIDKLEPLLKAESYGVLIEQKLSAAPRMGGLVKDVQLNGITVQRNSDGAAPACRLRYQWLVTYFTNERDPTAAV